MADKKPAPKPAARKPAAKKPVPAPEPAVPDNQHGPFATYTEIRLANGSVIGLRAGETYLEE